MNRIATAPSLAQRVVLGPVLAVAALGKVHYVVSPHLFIINRYFEVIIIVAELSIGICFLLDLFRRAAWISGFAIFVAFASYSLVRILLGRNSCHCLGTTPASSHLMLVFDLAAIVVLLLIRTVTPELKLISYRRSESRIALSHLLLVTTVIGSGSCGAAVAISLTANENDYTFTTAFSLADPSTWIDQPFPLLQYTDIAEELRHGEWIVLLYRRECPKCQALNPVYQALSRHLFASGSQTRVALVETTGAKPLAGTVESDDAPLNGRLLYEDDGVIPVPLELRIDDGRVRSFDQPSTEWVAVENMSPASWLIELDDSEKAAVKSENAK